MRAPSREAIRALSALAAEVTRARRESTLLLSVAVVGSAIYTVACTVRPWTVHAWAGFVIATLGAHVIAWHARRRAARLQALLERRLAQVRAD